MRTSLFWAIMQRVLVIPYRGFGIPFLSRLQGSRIQDGQVYRILDPWRWDPIRCPETSVRNCHYSLRNIPEERSSQQYVIFYSSTTIRRELILVLPWQQSTVLYCWQRYVCEQWHKVERISFHSKYGYANAPRCFTNVACLIMWLLRRRLWVCCKLEVNKTIVFWWRLTRLGSDRKTLLTD
jgi:hypothetical protein